MTQEQNTTSPSEKGSVWFADYSNGSGLYTGKNRSQFEIALDQKEQIVRQEYEIDHLRKKIATIESDTVKKVNGEWEERIDKLQTEVKAQSSAQSFWWGFGTCFVIFLLLIVLQVLKLV